MHARMLRLLIAGRGLSVAALVGQVCPERGRRLKNPNENPLTQHSVIWYNRDILHRRAAHAFARCSPTPPHVKPTGCDL